MSIWLLPFVAMFSGSALADSPLDCRFSVDEQPYSQAPTCGAFKTLRVSCATSSVVKKGGYDLVEYKLWLSHLDVSAKKQFDGDKVAKFLDRSSFAARVRF
jgi:hypothetical protein